VRDGRCSRVANFFGYAGGEGCIPCIPYGVSAPGSGEARGFKVGGLRGRVREGVYLLSLGPGGCAAGKIFKLQMHAGEF
jgi:hypothetical protein